MSDEPEIEEAEESANVIYSDGEFALAGYGTSAAEIIQAVGNFISQTQGVPLGHPYHAISLDLLNRAVAQIDPKPRGSTARLVKD